MNRNIEVSQRPLFFTVYLFCLLALSGTASGQEPRSMLGLEEYQIVGKDTRVYEITGDMESTIGFISIPFELPEEKRRIEASHGLMDDDERVLREELFEIAEGPYAQADLLAGSRTVASLWGKASLDMDSRAGTMRVTSRTAREHTPTNSAPEANEIEAVGYSGVTGPRYVMGLRYTGENEYRDFRSRDREAGRYRGDFTLRTELKETWDLAGRINITGGTYKDAELPYNKNELNIGGKISASGEIYDISLITHAGAEYLKFDDEASSIASTGVKGNMLLWNNMGFQFGANIYVFKMQDDNSEMRFYPNASFDWALTHSSFIKISFKPSVARHSHSDLYDRNGLVSPVPVLFEDKKRNIDGEIGWRFKPGSLISTGIFYVDSDQSLVFSRKGDFFDVLENASVKMTGFRIKGKYDRSEKWGFNGEFLVRNTSWNVPYLPAVQADIHGYMTPYKKWLFRGAVHFFGEHYLKIDLEDTAGSFFTIDFGVERELLSFLSVYIDIRNITDSEGTWWTNQYRIPGIGLYAGLKSRY